MKIFRFLIAGASVACSLVSFGQGWTSVAPLSDGFVSNHSYGFALDSMGYIVAGESTEGFTNAFYQYDPSADAWTALDNFPGPARGYTIGDDWDGKAWMGFGLSESGYLNDLWVFDPDSMAWTEKASCPCSARTHPAFIAEDDKIFVGLGGGQNGDMNDWWEYDMASDTWSQKPNFPSSERHHPYQFGIDGLIYVGFGHNGPNIFNEWYRYDPATEEWDEMATLPAEGRVAGSQFIHEGMGYALSGDGDDHNSMETGELWQYNPGADSWSAWPEHPGMSRWAPASFVLNDEAYLINGMSLDPGTFDYMSTNWKLALQPEAAYDVALTSFTGPGTICSGEATPIEVQLTNWGADTLFAGDAQALTVQMAIDGEVALSSDWSGELSTYASASFTLGTYMFDGSTDFTLEVLVEDENSANNALDATVENSTTSTTQWGVTLLTDNWGGETGWEVRDSQDNLVESAAPGSYGDETVYEFTISLPSAGCYSFSLIDTYGDGMNGTAWGGVNGSCTLESLDGSGEPLDVFFAYDGTFGFETLTEIVDASTSVSLEEAEMAFSVFAFPNPVSGELTVSGLQGPTQWEALDGLGRAIDGGSWSSPQAVVDATDWPAGVVMMRVTNGTEIHVLRLVKE